MAQILAFAPPRTALLARELDAAERMGLELAPRDPFGFAQACERSPSGQHEAIAACGEIVCAHCAAIFWR